jgi:hypothetical protein
MPVDDAFTVALLHMDGVDGSTTFTDESGKVWTANGAAQIDTAQSVFGGASGLFDATSNCDITSPDSNDWQLDDGSNSNAWTIDLRLRFNSGGGTLQSIINQRTDSNNYWQFLYNTGTLQFLVYSGGTSIINISRSWSPSVNIWYHIALVKNGSLGYVFYVDGVNLGAALTDTDVLPNLSGSARIGTHDGTNWRFTGWLDELRVSKGVARWTSDFTPPAAAYASAQNGDMLLMF